MAHGWPSNGSHYKHIREASYTPTSEAMEELQPLTMDQHFGYIAQVQPEVYGTEPSEVAFCMASNPLKTGATTITRPRCWNRSTGSSAWTSI